tara:strand:- start:1046 stop:1477 length:432 start_codon:yes stop_codon:yes gene_type:complete
MDSRYYGEDANRHVKTLADNTHDTYYGCCASDKNKAIHAVKVLGDSYNERGNIIYNQHKSMRHVVVKILSMFNSGELSSERTKELITLANPLIYDDALFESTNSNATKVVYEDNSKLPLTDAKFHTTNGPERPFVNPPSRYIF